MGGMDLKNLSLLVWVTQLGLSVSVPPAGFILLAVWLRSAFSLGQWIIWVGIVLGIYGAVRCLVSTLKAMKHLTGDKKKEPPPVAFNDHS